MDDKNKKELTQLGTIFCVLSSLVFGPLNFVLFSQYMREGLVHAAAVVMFFLFITMFSAGLIGYALGWMVGRSRLSKPTFITAIITIVAGALLPAAFLYDVHPWVALFIFILQLAVFVLFLTLALYSIIKRIFSNRWVASQEDVANGSE